MATDQVQTGFVRNRRFLIAVSVGLACFKVLGLKIDHITILGNTADIAHPERVEFVAWVLWAWAYSQYIVWFRDVGGWQDFLQAIKDDCERSVVRRLKPAEAPAHANASNMQYFTEQAHIPADQVAAEPVISFMEIVGDGKQRPRYINFQVTAFLRDTENRYEIQAPATRFEVVIPNEIWRRSWLRAAGVAFVTRRFTLEYFAPFAIGLMPVVLLWLARH